MIENLHIFVKAGKHGRSIAVEENSRLVEYYQEMRAGRIRLSTPWSWERLTAS